MAVRSLPKRERRGGIAVTAFHNTNRPKASRQNMSSVGPISRMSSESLRRSSASPIGSVAASCLAPHLQAAFAVRQV